jgi:hypothetical protein
MRSDIFGARNLGSCGANQAAVAAPTDGSEFVSMATPFVGRPAMMSDRCAPWGSDGVMPSTQAVWFGSPLPVGVRSEGVVVAETRAVGKQKVTVFAADSDTRRQILGSAQQVDVDGNGCPTRALQQPVAGPAALDPVSLSVCVYSQDTGVPVLLWSGRAGAGAARAYLDAFASPTAGAGEACTTTPSGQWVALGVHDATQTATRWDIANLGCGRLVSADGAEAALLPSTVAPWALPGVQAYVGAPRSAGSELAPYFQQTVMH